MSRRLIDRNPDLRGLVEDGYEVEIRGPNLVVGHVPYVDPDRQVRYGTLVMTLALAGDETIPPTDHTARFAGSVPCDSSGRPLEKIINGAGGDLGHGLVVDHSFSAKPADGYRDHHHKVSAYVSMLASHAAAIDSSATAKTFRVLESSPEESPFRYVDTATSRAGLEVLADRFRALSIAIIGLGGTGSYILDLVAKTPVAQIHLFDGDRFLQHNPFRSPGAMAVRELRGGPNKARHWAKVYRRMRRGIHVHPVYVDASNVTELRRMDFVFIAIDDGPSCRLIVDALEALSVSFIDVGMGINEVDGRLSGATRVSVGTPDHRMDRRRVPFHANGPDNQYVHNVQIADLNALNATLAVIKWKKLVGFYADLEGERAATYSIVMNSIVNRDRR